MGNVSFQANKPDRALFLHSAQDHSGHEMISAGKAVDKNTHSWSSQALRLCILCAQKELKKMDLTVNYHHMLRFFSQYL
jgi:hypothetical protein